MKQAMLPLNIGLLQPTKDQLKTIRPVTTLDIFEGPGGDFHENGLFSTLTFGRIGDPMRDRRFGYIELKLPVLHPVIYTRLIKLKGLYKDILSGKEYAIWNSELRDFERATIITGYTGYSFFMSYWNELNPKRSGSSMRDIKIDLIEKYKHNALLTDLLVLPAGLRDLEIAPDGRTTMDEVNELYQSVLMMVRTLPDRMREADYPIYDRTRFSLTVKIVEIYDHFEKLIRGKHGFIQSRFASRRVFNGSRNVISSLDPSTMDLSKPNRPKFNDTVIGLLQASKLVLPKTIYALKNGILGEIFGGDSSRIELPNQTTLMREWVDVDNKTIDQWTTDEGLEQFINNFTIIEKRHQYVKIGSHYLALVYVDNKDNYCVLRSIDDLPSNLNPAFVRPMTNVELLYLSGLNIWKEIYGFVTRYPIENLMSSYPTKLYVRTTTAGTLRYELDISGNRKGSDFVALEYPILIPDKIPQYHDSTAVNCSRLSNLGADFDGDMVSVVAGYSNETQVEMRQYFKTRTAYIKPGGGLAHSVGIDTLMLALNFMTQ